MTLSSIVRPPARRRLPARIGRDDQGHKPRHRVAVRRRAV